jgi:hypothetical protein
MTIGRFFLMMSRHDGERWLLVWGPLVVAANVWLGVVFAGYTP